MPIRRRVLRGVAVICPPVAFAASRLYGPIAIVIFPSCDECVLCGALLQAASAHVVAASRACDVLS
jgi:hypothetical protein